MTFTKEDIDDLLRLKKQPWWAVLQKFIEERCDIKYREILQVKVTSKDWVYTRTDTPIFTMDDVRRMELEIYNTIKVIDEVIKRRVEWAKSAKAV